MNAEESSLSETVTKVVRTVRHDLGDFLQMVYSVVALLQARLPADATVERSLIGGLRPRAEASRLLLDIAQDFLNPPTLVYGAVDLQLVTRSLVERCAQLYPHLEFAAQVDQPVPLVGDPQRLEHVGHLLLAHACHSAEKRVTIRASRSDQEVLWEVCDDGSAPGAADRARLFEPFAFSRTGRLSLGLAPVAQLIGLHGGRWGSEASQPDGLRVWVIVPVEPRAAALTPLAASAAR